VSLQVCLLARLAAIECTLASRAHLISGSGTVRTRMARCPLLHFFIWWWWDEFISSLLQVWAVALPFWRQS
jgi:hypothetical protein